jgi:hypothetical protein
MLFSYILSIIFISNTNCLISLASIYKDSDGVCNLYILATDRAAAMQINT